MKGKRTAQELFEIARRHIAPNYAPFDVMGVEGRGCWVRDAEGVWRLDMLSNYSASSFGHGHPRLVRALVHQARKLAVFCRAFHNEQLTLLAKELSEFCGMEMVLPMNTGAEAVETAIKLARKWAYTRKGVPFGEAEIIVCANNFHGRTTTIISFSTEPQYRDAFGPHTPGFRVIPFGDADALREAIGSHTAAFLMEPIQGEGGIIVPRDGYLRKVREICTGANILWIADEIQTGLGRTGKIFACDHESVKPDLLILGKALGGGLVPISAVVGTRDIIEVFAPGDHGSTFGGNPLACCVAREALKILQEEGLAERAQELGAYLRERLRRIRSPYVTEVRGKGLLVGVELRRDGPTAHDLSERLVAQGVLCKDTRRYVMRFAPPLTITREELDWALERIAMVLTT